LRMRESGVEASDSLIAARYGRGTFTVKQGREAFPAATRAHFCLEKAAPPIQTNPRPVPLALGLAGNRYVMGAVYLSPNGVPQP